MEKKKSINLLTLIFIGIIIALTIVFVISFYNKQNIAEENIAINEPTNQIQNNLVVNEELTDKITDEIPEQEGIVEETIELNHDYDYLKIYPEEDFVFKKEEVSYGAEDYYKELSLSVININIDEFKRINNEIETLYNNNKSKYLSDNLDDYDYINSIPSLYVSYGLIDDILEISYTLYDGNESEYKYYHIDLKNQKILDDKEFLIALGVDSKKLEELIEDTLYSNYLYESGHLKEFKNLYASYEDFKNEIKYIKDDGSNEEKFIYNFDKICDFCDISYNQYSRLICISGIAVPSMMGHDGR